MTRNQIQIAHRHADAGRRRFGSDGTQGGAAIDSLHLIDRLEEMVAEGRRMPIGAGVVVDRRRLLDLVDQMRAALPNEIKEAEDILKRRDDVLLRADEEAQIKLRRVQEQIDDLLSHDSLVREAQARADMLEREAEARGDRMLADTETRAKARMAEAEKLANEQMDEADRYATEMLRRLDEQLQLFGRNVRTALDSLETRPATAAATSA
jgi:cell division septum initiation protein DivIVA